MNKLVKKKIIAIVAGAAGALAPIFIVILVVILIFSGVAAAFSTRETMSMKKCANVKELKDLLDNKIDGYKVDPDELEEMMISKTGLKRIVNAVIDWNDGEWSKNDDRLKATISEKTNDYYITNCVVEKERKYEVEVKGYDHGGDNSATCTYPVTVNDYIPVTLLPKLSKKGVYFLPATDIDYSGDEYLTQNGIVYRKVPRTGIEEVKVESFKYRYDLRYNEKGEDDYRVSKTGQYVFCPEKNMYVTVKESTIKHIEERTETLYEECQTEHVVDFKTDKKKVTRIESPALNMKYDRKIQDSAAKNGPTWNMTVSTDDLYKDYPVDWQTIYLFAVYSLIDEREDETEYGKDIDSDYDQDDGNPPILKVKKKHIDELISAIMPKFTYETDVFTALSEFAKNDSNLFRRLKNIAAFWAQKNIDLFYDLDKTGVNVNMTAPEVIDLFLNGYLSGGSPIEVEVYWESKKYNEYLDENGKPVKVEDYVVHRSVVYVPYSTIKSVDGLIATYKYDPNAITKNYSFDIVKEFENNERVLGNSFGIMREDAIKLDDKDMLEGILADLATQRICEPVESRFNLDKLRKMLSVGERDIDMFATAINELPGGAPLAEMLQCAEEYEGTNYSVEEAIILYNNSKKEKGTEDVLAGLLGTKKDSKTGNRY